MKQRLAMQVLGEIMDWEDDRAQKEFAWLRLMSDFKYDSYGDYVAGARFIESLAARGRTSVFMEPLRMSEPGRA